MPRKPKQPRSQALRQRHALLSSPQKVSRLLMLAALTLAIGIHLVGLFHRGGLWRDEVSTANIASRRMLSEVLAGMSFNTLPIAVPLGMFSLGRFFGPWGTSESVVRPICFLVGIATPMLWYAFPARSRRIDTLVLVLLQGASITIAQWGDTLRAYGLGVLALNLLFFSLLRLTDNDDRINRSLVFLSFLLAIHSCYQAWPLSVILILGCAAFLFFSSACPRPWQLIAFLFGVLVVGGGTAIPYLPVLAKTAAVHKIAQEPSVHAIGVLNRFAGDAMKSEAVFLAAVGLVCSGLVLLCFRLAQEPKPGLQDHSNKNSVDTILLCIAATSTTAGLAVHCSQIALAKQPPYPWHFVLLLSFLAFPISVVLPIVFPRLAHRNLVAACLLVIAVAQLAQSIPILEKRLTNLPFLSSYLQGQAAAGDMVFVLPWESGISFAHYYRGKAEWQTVPPISDHTTNRFDLAAQWMSEPNFSGMTEEQQAKIAEVLKNGHVVWVVGQLSAANSASELLFLPPAPTKEWGWRNGPYYEVWSRNLHTLLVRNATHAAVIEEAMGKASDYQPYEYAALYKFWRQAD